MALDLAKLTQTAVGAATKAGVTTRATITRNPVPDPITGAVSGTPVSQTVDVVQADARRYAKASDAAWTGVTTALFVAAADLTFTPKRGDTVLFAGITGRLIAIDEYAPTGIPFGYFLGLGT
ncbi:MAG: hypothetical protein ACK6DP_12390 [Gemmatimonas sp.]|jgi:hypothetical protein|uniref:hypothetical protein n=1 Tax=Gemmatimonas sp. TaxID=1962908 RepID=UPI00391F2D0C